MVPFGALFDLAQPLPPGIWAAKCYHLHGLWQRNPLDSLQIVTDVEMETNDSGGVAAKHGFLFQDCVAASHVTRMLRDKTIRSVRCEVTDDIDIVYYGHVDFVQVKSTEKTRWNISDIVKNSKGTVCRPSLAIRWGECSQVPGSALATTDCQRC